ncbi:DUF2116 family Zn-ribbon domain-containing protein [Bacillus sp. FJAT-22090]
MISTYSEGEEKMICRECGNETEENKMFCSEKCRESYMDYLNDK